MSRPGPEVFGLSRRGSLRRANEDRFLVLRTRDGLLAAVADGVGAGRGGGRAATLAVRSLRGLDQDREPAGALLSRMLSADLAIRAARDGREDLARMSTTLTAAYVLPGRALFAHAGDSRLYLLRGGLAARLTTDHRLLQPYVDAGDLSEAQAREHPRSAQLRRCLGCPGLEPDTGELGLRAGDVLFLCTDGLHGAVSDAEILGRLGRGANLRSGVAALAREARTGGAGDDFTLLAVRV